MTDLPVCRLCKCSAHIDADRATCSNSYCEIYGHFFERDNWRKLMYVPKKITPREPFEAFDLGYERGYNNAIDDMLRGGE